MNKALTYVLPVLVSVVFHGGLFYAVVVGWEASARKPRVVTPQFIEAKLVEYKAKSPKKSAAPKRNIIDLTKRQQAEKEQKKQKAARQAAQKKKEQERIKKEREDAELKAKQQKAQQEQQLREKQFAESLEFEDEVIQADEAEIAAQSYMAQIQNRIANNWSRPAIARREMTCDLRIQLVPTGEVVSVSVTRSSGNAAFDRSAELAVKKVGRFTELQGMDSMLFEKRFRQFTLVFNPMDLRL